MESLSRPPVPQAAVIPCHHDRVCLVLSSNGRRWVLPKGGIEPGETPGEAALREAWEEAGLTGRLSRDPIGSYMYTKNGRRYHVTLFLMEVCTAASHWPEATLRTRRWIATTSAYRAVEQPELRRLLRYAFRNSIRDTVPWPFAIA